jgi:hypothetical protein
MRERSGTQESLRRQTDRQMASPAGRSTRAMYTGVTTHPSLSGPKMSPELNFFERKHENEDPTEKHIQPEMSKDHLGSAPTRL